MSRLVLTVTSRKRKCEFDVVLVLVGSEFGYVAANVDIVVVSLR